MRQPGWFARKRGALEPELGFDEVAAAQPEPPERAREFGPRVASEIDSFGARGNGAPRCIAPT